jgi:hypothetical protein
MAMSASATIWRTSTIRPADIERSREAQDAAISLARSGRLLDISGGQAVFVTVAVLAAPVLATAMNRRHPGEWNGALLGATVLLAAFAGCRLADLNGFSAVAGPTALLVALLPAVAIVLYPALQVPRRTALAISALAAAAFVVGTAVAAIALTRDDVPSPWWVTDHPASAGAVANGLLAVYTVVVVVGAAITAALVVGRYRAGPRHARASARPLVYPALGWTISATATAVWTFVAGIAAPQLDFSTNDTGTAFALLPAVLVGALAAGIGWLDLAVRQPGRTSGVPRVVLPPVQIYLARALADPSIRVAYPAGTAAARFDEVEFWVDRDGRILALRPDAPDRAIAVIERAGVVIGLVEHDAVTASRPDAVELVATGAGLMMETEWLTASANRDLEVCRLLAIRLLSAADEPRAALRSQLVEGPLAELDAVALALADGALLADCVPALSAVTAEVRAISHGVFPDELAAGELTAYLVTRDDPDATVLASDGGLRITTRRDPEPQVRDRVTALGGVVAAAGAGWIVEVPKTGTLG